MELSLKNKTGIFIWASRGIGKAIAFFADTVGQSTVVGAKCISSATDAHGAHA